MRIRYFGVLAALLACSAPAVAMHVSATVPDISHEIAYYDPDGLAPFIIMTRYGRLLSKGDEPAVDVVVNRCWMRRSIVATTMQQQYDVDRERRKCVREGLKFQQHFGHMIGYRMLEDITLESTYPEQK